MKERKPPRVKLTSFFATALLTSFFGGVELELAGLTIANTAMERK
jgi:hypothetical protein